MNTTELRDLIATVRETQASIGGGRTAKMAQWMRQVEDVLDGLVTVLDSFAEEVSVGLINVAQQPPSDDYDIRAMPGETQVVEPVIIEESFSNESRRRRAQVNLMPRSEGE